MSDIDNSNTTTLKKEKEVEVKKVSASHVRKPRAARVQKTFKPIVFTGEASKFFRQPAKQNTRVVQISSVASCASSVRGELLACSVSSIQRWKNLIDQTLQANHFLNEEVSLGNYSLEFVPMVRLSQASDGQHTKSSATFVDLGSFVQGCKQVATRAHDDTSAAEATASS